MFKILSTDAEIEDTVAELAKSHSDIKVLYKLQAKLFAKSLLKGALIGTAIAGAYLATNVVIDNINSDEDE